MEKIGEYPSLEKVGGKLAEQGYKNKQGGRFTRQWVRQIMSLHPEGRALLARCKRGQPARNVIVENRAGVIEWLMKHGMVGVQRVSPQEVTVSLVDNAYVYGDIPTSLAVLTRSTWLVAIGNIPVRENVSCEWLDRNNARLVEYKIKRYE